MDAEHSVREDVDGVFTPAEDTRFKAGTAYKQGEAMCHSEHEQSSTSVIPAAIPGSRALGDAVADAHRQAKPVKGLCFQGADGELWSGTFTDCRGKVAEALCLQEAGEYEDESMTALHGGRVVPVLLTVDE